jgi:hypothetical protein
MVPRPLVDGNDRSCSPIACGYEEGRSDLIIAVIFDHCV